MNDQISTQMAEAHKIVQTEHRLSDAAPRLAVQTEADVGKEAIKAVEGSQEVTRH